MQVNLGFTSSLKKWFSKVILCMPWLCCLESRNVEQAGVTDFYHAVVALLIGRCCTASQNFPHFSKVRNHRLSGLWGQREKKKTMSPIHSYKSSSLFSCSVASNSLRPHGFQHTRLPCLSPSPRACSNLCPFSQWCHPTISSSVQFSSVAQSCPTLCNSMNRSTPGLPVHHQLLEFTKTQVHRVSDAIQPSHPLLSPSPPAPNPSQHQAFFQWVNSSYEVAKVLEFQLQHQSFQWTPRTDLL